MSQLIKNFKHHFNKEIDYQGEIDRIFEEIDKKRFGKRINPSSNANFLISIGMHASLTATSVATTFYLFSNLNMGFIGLFTPFVSLSLCSNWGFGDFLNKSIFNNKTNRLFKLPIYSQLEVDETVELENILSAFPRFKHPVSTWIADSNVNALDRTHYKYLKSKVDKINELKTSKNIHEKESEVLDNFGVNELVKQKKMKKTLTKISEDNFHTPELLNKNHTQNTPKM